MCPSCIQYYIGFCDNFSPAHCKQVWLIFCPVRYSVWELLFFKKNKILLLICDLNRNWSPCNSQRQKSSWFGENGSQITLLKLWWGTWACHDSERLVPGQSLSRLSVNTRTYWKSTRNEAHCGKNKMSEVKVMSEYSTSENYVEKLFLSLLNKGLNIWRH